MFGVLNIYKPKGLTSHDVVNIVRKIFKIKQVGHTGTLDPFAEGVLPVCLGKAARLIDYFDDDKEYLATVQFGTSTNTYDIEGSVTAKCDKIITRIEVEKALNNFKGEISQLPPKYSAIKVNGKKLYEYAREGQDVKIEPRKVNIYKSELVNFDSEKQTAEILIKCSKGTYIRSIANDLGIMLGSYAHLSKLVRTKAGKFDINSSVKLPITLVNEPDKEFFKKYIISDEAYNILSDAVVSPTDAISLPVLSLNNAEYERVSHGNSINYLAENIKSGDFLILVYNNNVVAVGQFDSKVVKVKKVLI